ncbi:MAG: class I SAM-dependent methyltransferase [Thermoguttaceae bacterium]|nr:class I SAM-dependent methyltransferase [Thermoguttaceae bacterium]MDW8037703.1 class I SAM-dependent methyltransferase [Thermoguttaceae bacterium]
MFALEQYELLDFGRGRRLERFGSLVLDRPCPAAEKLPQEQPEIWSQAHARYQRLEGGKGQWVLLQPDLPDRWTIQHPPFQLELKRTEFGQVGLFPEHAVHWDWTSKQIAETAVSSEAPVKLLHLFAYTGGGTLAAAAAGAEVVHVDAAKNVVAWARRNAALSGLADRPIRWIVEDVRKYCKRALRRGEQFQAVLLDPPTYGHGAHGEVWRLDRDLPELLELCARLTTKDRQWILLTAHTPGFGPKRLRQLVARYFDDPGPDRLTAGRLLLLTRTGRALPSGVFVRWQR